MVWWISVGYTNLGKMRPVRSSDGQSCSIIMSSWIGYKKHVIFNACTEAQQEVTHIWVWIKKYPSPTRVAGTSGCKVDSVKRNASRSIPGRQQAISYLLSFSQKQFLACKIVRAQETSQHSVKLLRKECKQEIFNLILKWPKLMSPCKCTPIRTILSCWESRVRLKLAPLTTST